jgi:hypothetical protein
MALKPYYDSSWLLKKIQNPCAKFLHVLDSRDGRVNFQLFQQEAAVVNCEPVGSISQVASM